MNTKIIHTADVQLGAQFTTLGEKAQEQREQLKKTFHNVLETGIKEGSAVVLVCGDLFDSNHPAHDLVEFVRNEIKYLAENNVQLCIVPGHHDCLDEHGIYSRERFDDEFANVFIFRNPEGEIKEYSDLDLAIFAKPNIASTSTRSPFPDMGRLNSSMRYKIIAAHGDLQIPGKSAENYHPVSISELENLVDIGYVALGHWHSIKDCSSFGKFKMPVWYAGSPELVAVDQGGSGNILIVEIGDGDAKVKPIELGKRKSVALVLDVSDFEDLNAFKSKILESANKDSILSVELTGLNTNNISFDIEKLEEELEPSFFYFQIKDKSHLAIQEIPEYSDALIQGQFVKIMRKKIKEAADAEKKIYEDALQIGLMELEGKEII